MFSLDNRMLGPRYSYWIFCSSVFWTLVCLLYHDKVFLPSPLAWGIKGLWKINWRLQNSLTISRIYPVYFCVSVVSTFSIHTPPSKYGGITRKRFNPPKGSRVIQSHSQLLPRNIGLPLLYPNYSSLWLVPWFEFHVIRSRAYSRTIADRTKYIQFCELKTQPMQSTTTGRCGN